MQKRTKKDVRVESQVNEIKISTSCLAFEMTYEERDIPIKIRPNKKNIYLLIIYISLPFSCLLAD